jgi:hypothetical protein
MVSEVLVQSADLAGRRMALGTDRRSSGDPSRNELQTLIDEPVTAAAIALR